MQTQLVRPTPSAHNAPLLIKGLLARPLQATPDSRIHYRDQLSMSYRQLGERVAQLAHGLTALGVGPGDTVAVMDWDSHRYLECYFAIPMIGAILHTVNIRLSPEQLLYTINHAEDDVILINAEFLPMLLPVRDKLSTVKKIVLLTDNPDSSLDGVDHEYEAMLQENSTVYDFPDFDENTIATTFYTTGTTGLPKGVFFSHRQLVLHTYGVQASISGYDTFGRVGSSDVYMPMTPMFHVHAWGMPYLMTLLGAKQIYPGRYEPQMLLRLVMEHKVTFSHCVPTIMHMLLSSPAAASVDLSGWKVIIGGSALSKGLCRSALERGINIFTGYGMSETCPVLTLAQLKAHMLDWDKEEQVTIRCRTGLPITGVELRVVDSAGKSQPADGKSTGEVVVRAPWLTQGYLKEPEKSEELWQDGWLHTGDIGYRDQEGYLQITDRLKDVIKTGGEWVSSLELEDVISQHPGVGEVAVIGVPDEKWGERPLALVVAHPGQGVPLQPEAVRSTIQRAIDNGVLPKYAMPDQIQIVEAIAKTSVGKLNKKELRREYAG